MIIQVSMVRKYCRHKLLTEHIVQRRRHTETQTKYSYYMVAKLEGYKNYTAKLRLIKTPPNMGASTNKESGTPDLVP